MMEASATNDVGGGTTAPTTRQLVVTSCDNIKGSVDVDESMTLEDVRTLLIEEFDDDMLPSDDWAFFVDGIRISAKQEKRRKAWDLLSKDVRVESKVLAIKRQRQDDEEAANNVNKRPKLHHHHHHSNAITPHDISETSTYAEGKAFGGRDGPSVATTAPEEKDDDHSDLTPLVLDNKLQQQQEEQGHLPVANDNEKSEDGGGDDDEDTLKESSSSSLPSSIPKDNNPFPPAMAGEYDVVVPKIANSLGMTIRVQNGSVRFDGYKALPDGRKGPAEESNLIRNVGDKIIAIDGESTVDMSLPAVVAMIKGGGKDNAPVSLRFLEQKFDFLDTIPGIDLPNPKDKFDIVATQLIVAGWTRKIASPSQQKELGIDPESVVYHPPNDTSLALNESQIRIYLERKCGWVNDDKGNNSSSNNNQSIISQPKQSAAEARLPSSKDAANSFPKASRPITNSYSKKSTHVSNPNSKVTTPDVRKGVTPNNKKSPPLVNPCAKKPPPQSSVERRTNSDDQKAAQDTGSDSDATVPLPSDDDDDDDDDSVAKEAASSSANKDKNAPLTENKDQEEDDDDVMDLGGDDDREASSGEQQQQEQRQQEPEENPHKEADEAMKQSQDVLKNLITLLNENKLFCSDMRRKEWLDEIQKLNDSSRPRTIFGVLGNTGVGKSSLLNALLDEAAVLPTSGSRGCTAAVVELIFHTGLLEASEPKNLPLYQGVVEFMQLEDWRKELKVLVDECSTQEKTVYAVQPEEQRAPDAAAAWAKIDQVYGRGTMYGFRGKATNYMYDRLAYDKRIVRLLTASEPGAAYNYVTVTEGEVESGSEQTMDLLQPYEKMKRKNRRFKKNCAKSFRNKINSYVYRKGNGNEPQTWPLIRKVTLRGPWAVLSTGAILVDLPGVRDANAARAKVSENYLQNCNHIAIVAPIKRAVDDGTAKELLGEQFKRRLLMDGQYGNVFFICTQTDDLEATETMRDHQDVAKQVEGRWERMDDLATEIAHLENKINHQAQTEEDLESDVKEAASELREARKELKNFTAENDSDGDIDMASLEALQAALEEAKKEKANVREKLRRFRLEEKSVEADQLECSKLHRRLKPICARVRNEYSTSCLQEDFKAGLEQLYNDGGHENNSMNTQQTALPEDYNMDVFCISANDYLKVMKIKPSSDGSPNTFSDAQDTQIPQLRRYIHQTTARYCKSFAKTFVENSNDILDRMKLLAADADVPTGRAAYRSKSLFESEMRNLNQQIGPIASEFQKSLNKEVKSSLTPSLNTGAERGRSAAMSTVFSWGSANRRSKQERRPDKNGLYWSTYNAVVRRDGVYTSASAGQVDFNQELCDPMEREFSTDWQRVMDATIVRRLAEIEARLLHISTSANQTLARSLQQNGLDNARLSNMLNASSRSCSTSIKTAFQAMRRLAVDSQRELSRCLLPSVQQRMQNSYDTCNSVARGSGVFNRMKGAMQTNTQDAVASMFGEATSKILNGISGIVEQLEKSIMAVIGQLEKSMASVFSICWEDDKLEGLMDPSMQAKIRECRDAMLPEINKLCRIQNEACKLLGIEIKEVEFEMMAVETFEQGLERKLEEAKKRGNAFDLCDDDSDNPFLDVKPEAKVKSEAGLAAATKTHSTSKDANFGKKKSLIIDLCDSDDDDDWRIPPPSGLTRGASRRVKADPNAGSI